MGGCFGVWFLWFFALVLCLRLCCMMLVWDDVLGVCVFLVIYFVWVGFWLLGLDLSLGWVCLVDWRLSVLIYG